MRLSIKVKPNSKRDEVSLGSDGTIKVRIKAPPIDGKANKYLIGFLATYFGVSKSKVALLRGEASQYKTLEIEANEELIQNKIRLLPKDIKPEF